METSIKQYFWTALFLLALLFALTSFGAEGDVFRLGIIGTTTSHVPAAVKVINSPEAMGIYAEFEITAIYTGGMPDNPNSWDRREKYTAECVEKGIKVYATVEELVQHVDGVLLESVDGRPHLEQAKPVIAAGKPLYIDKPLAGSLADALEIFRLAEEKGVPVFTSSSLRYDKDYQLMRNEAPWGKVLGADAVSPGTIQEKHPDLYWYGVHGVESLFTLLGPDCLSVSRTKTEMGDLAVGVWTEGRIGTFRGTRAGKHTYSAYVFCEKGNQPIGKYEGYEPLFLEICQFFKTGKAPVEPRESINMFAFMTAADESNAQDGKHILLADAIARAKSQKQVTVNLVLDQEGKTTWNDSPLTNDSPITIDAIAIKVDEIIKAGILCRVILNNRAGADFEIVKKVLVALDKAYLANYLY